MNNLESFIKDVVMIADKSFNKNLMKPSKSLSDIIVFFHTLSRVSNQLIIGSFVHDTKFTPAAFAFAIASV